MQKRFDFRPMIKAALEVVKNHELETKGQYARWIWQDENGKRNLGVNEYGCADAANILYTINEFYCDEETRQARIKALQDMQNPETGLFSESTHHTYHTTAHCTAALQLFDAKPKYPITALHKYYDKDTLYDLLENGIRWVEAPWRDSHLGAGIYAALVNADEMTEEFQKNYFDWYWENASPVFGFWKKGVIETAEFGNVYTREGQAAVYQYMAGGFHYMFNHEYAKMPYRYPEKMVDACIKMYTENGLPETFGKRADFLEVDWVYSLNRALRQCNHRRDEAIALMEDFAGKLLENHMSYDMVKEDRFNDLHCLFGLMCCVAELQEALPGQIITEKPLRLVLNRRPFI